MPKRLIPCVLVTAGLLATAVALNPNSGLAAGDCFAQPNRPPAPGGHWYYHSDRVNNRKCWFLVEPTMPPAEALAASPFADANLQPTFPSFFSSLAAGFAGTNPAGAPQGYANGDAGTAPTARPDDPDNDVALRARRPNPAHRSSAALASQHRPSSARPRVDLEEERPAQPADQAQRDALFQEFMRWKERQKP
jgi:hypothetical protein